MCKRYGVSALSDLPWQKDGTKSCLQATMDLLIVAKVHRNGWSIEFSSEAEAERECEYDLTEHGLLRSCKSGTCVVSRKCHENFLNLKKSLVQRKRYVSTTYNFFHEFLNPKLDLCQKKNWFRKPIRGGGSLTNLSSTSN